MDNMLSEADKQNSEKTKPSTLIRGLDVCGEKIARKNNFSSALSRLFLKRGSDVSAATNDLGSNTEMPGGTSRIKDGVEIHSQGMIRSSNRSAVHLRPVCDDGFETHDKSKLRKAFSLDSLGEPSREVADHVGNEDHVYETVTPRRSRPPPPIPFEPLADKRKPNAGRISAENTTTKPDNDTGWIKKTNLKANSANYQNLLEESNLVKAISFHSNSLSEPCREVPDRPNEDDHLYDIVSPKCYKIPPSIPDKPLFFQKLKAGEISAENTTRKPDNDTASIKKINLKANSANYQNLPEKSNPRKAISFHSNSLNEPCREVPDRPNENDPVYDIVSPKCYKIPPSIPDKLLFRQKLKAGKISAENTKTKQDNNTALIKKTNLGANSANYQNLPEKSNPRKAISFHSNSLSEPCREATDRPNENDPVYDIVSPKCDKIPPSIPDKPLFRQKLKAGEISAENTTTKQDNNTALIKKANLEANSASQQNDSIAGPVREHHSSQEAGDFIPSDQSPGPCPESPTSAPIPEDLLCLSETGVGTLLRSLNMQCFVNRFQEEQIDGKLLVTLDDTALLCLGLNAFHVAKLREFIGGWRPNISENET
ncbi:uncharacterized protein LOC114529887 [Dendronephthya gigantea]|uniref:uncharacterized protein LOC114529887 n=1 Tax=Dendronephthya gigantea TaxID=151771 RepID=UPI00106CC82D|nr:uncharacterized protein LOC114529887 [Dendronephthya gigantea]